MTLPLCFTQFLKTLVNTAVCLSNRHAVVIHNNDHIRTQCSRIIQSFVCLAARQRSVTDKGNHVLLAFGNISPLSQPRCQTDRCRRMTDVKKVMLAFLRISIPRYVMVVCFFRKSTYAAGKDFMHITLVRYVIYNFIGRRIKHIV